MLLKKYHTDTIQAISYLQMLTRTEMRKKASKTSLPRNLQSKAIVLSIVQGNNLRQVINQFKNMYKKQTDEKQRAGLSNANYATPAWLPTLTW